MKKILLYLGIMLIGCGISFFGFRYALQAAKFGAISIPDAPYLFITTLQSNISTADTSMTLNSGTLKNGSSLSGYQCFTVDTGTATAEYVCGTATGASITSLIRGIDPMNPAATSSSLIYAHRRGADVRITDFPILQITKRLINGQDSFPARLSYDTSVASSSLSGQNLASVNFVTSQVNQGAATATGTTPGIVELSSRTQLSAGTMMAGVYTLVPQNAFFNSTFQAATTVPVTGANGKLAQGFLDLTQAFTWTGAHIFNSATTTLNATTTIAASASNNLYLNGVAYTFPSSQGNASTTITNNGSGTLTWDVPYPTPKSGTYTSSTPIGSGNLVIAHGLGRIPRYVKVTAGGTWGTSSGPWSSATWTAAGTAGVYCHISVVSSCDSMGNIFYLRNGASAASYASLSVDSTNLTFAISSDVTTTPKISFYWEAW